MYVSTTEVSVPEAMTIAVTEDTLTAELSDGRDHCGPIGLASPTGARNARGEKQLGVDWRWARDSLAGPGRGHQRRGPARRSKVGGKPQVLPAMACSEA